MKFSKASFLGLLLSMLAISPFDLVATPALAATAESAATTSGGNWTDSTTWVCQPGLSPCVPNNGTPVGDTYSVGINGGTVLLNGSSTLTSVTVDNLTLSRGSLQIADGRSLTVATGNIFSGNTLSVGSDYFFSNGGTLTINGTTGANGALNTIGSSITNITGGFSGASATVNVTGAAPSTLQGQYNLTGNTGGAALKYGSGTIAQVGDGFTNPGVLSINGPNAFVELASNPGSNSALSGLNTIAGNGSFQLNNGAAVTTTTGMTVNSGGQLGLDNTFGLSGGGSSLTIGGNLANNSAGYANADGGINVGSYYCTQTSADTLTVKGAYTTNGSSITNITGGSAGGLATMNVTGAAPSTLLGQYNLTGNTGGAVLEFGSGTITAIGDGLTNPGALTINGQNAFVELATSPGSNSALSGLNTIAGNGSLQLMNGAAVTTTTGMKINSGGQLRLDSGYNGGSSLTIGGNLVNNSGGVNLNYYGTLTVKGTYTTAGNSVTNINGGTINVTGAAPSTLLGQYNLTGNTGGAVLEYGSGGITAIGDGFTNWGVLTINGPNAFVELTSNPGSNSALSGLNTIAGNGSLQLQNGAAVTTTTGMAINPGGQLGLDYDGNGGSSLTVGGNLVNNSAGYGNACGGVNVGYLYNRYQTWADTLKVNGTYTTTGNSVTNISGGAGGLSSINVTGAAPKTLLGQYNLTGNTGGAVLEYGSGAITQIGDGLTNPGALTINGKNAFVELATSPGSNSALSKLATIAGNGAFQLADGAAVTTATRMTINPGGQLGLDSNYYYGNIGGSSLTIGGSLVNNSASGVNVGNGYYYQTSPDTLTVKGSYTTAGNSLTNIYGGGSSGATSAVNVTGAAPSKLQGQYNLIGNTGGAVLEYGSGTIAQIGDGFTNPGALTINGPNAFVELATKPDSNSALSKLATIAGNGSFQLQNGAAVTTTTKMTINPGGQLGLDYGGSGGSSLMIGGNLVNNSGSGVNVGSGSQTSPSTLTVKGTYTTVAGSITNITGGSAGATATVNVTGAAPSTLQGQYNLTGNTGGAVLEYGSGTITAIGDGSANSGALTINGSNAFVELASNPGSSALSKLATINSNGAFQLDNGAAVTTTAGMTVNSGGGLWLDSYYNYHGIGGSSLTIGGNLVNNSSYGVNVGYGCLTSADTLTVNGTYTTVGNSVTNIRGGSGSGATSTINVTGAAPSTLLGQYKLTGNTGGAVLEYGSGGVTQVGDGSLNPGQLTIDGANAFVELATSTGSNSAVTGLSTIAGNGSFQLKNGAAVTTTTNMTVNPGGQLALDAPQFRGDNYSNGGSSLTVGGSLVNNSAGYGNAYGGVNVGWGHQTSPSTLTVNGTYTTASGSITSITGGGSGGPAKINVTGTTYNSGTINIYGNGGLSAANLTNGGAINSSGGVINVGTSLGTAAGSLTMGSGATLTENILGTSSGQFGVINLSGPASTAGTLNVATLSGFHFSLGQTFDFMNFSAGSLTGTFTTLQYGSFSGSGTGILNIDYGLALDINYNNSGGQLVLDVVADPSADQARFGSPRGPVSTPEPASLSLLGIGLPALAWAVQRKARANG